jgi:hypothetical protein
MYGHDADLSAIEKQRILCSSIFDYLAPQPQGICSQHYEQTWCSCDKIVTSIMFTFTTNTRKLSILLPFSWCICDKFQSHLLSFFSLPEKEYA